MRKKIKDLVLSRHFIFVLALLFTVGLAAAVPIHNAPSKGESELLQALETPTNAPRHHGYPSATTDHILHERMDDFPGFAIPAPRIKMKMVHYATLTSMLPINVACGFLMQFFNTIKEKTNPSGGAWISLPERSSFDVTVGSFQLKFSCIGDTIPWSFVWEMADRCLEATTRGFAELFDAVFMSNSGNIAVQVTLQMLESSSGSGSGSGDREGSVPSITSP